MSTVKTPPRTTSATNRPITNTPVFQPTQNDVPVGEKLHGGHHNPDSHGAGPESINVAPQLSSINSGSGASFLNIDRFLSRWADAGVPVQRRLRIKYDVGRTPIGYELFYRVDDGPWVMKYFDNRVGNPKDGWLGSATK